MGRLLLVRHGQASWGAADYDQLSGTGEKQARQVGGWLTRHGVKPSLLVHGGMKRHRQTLDGMLECAPWNAEVEHDDGWAEFDHVAVLAAHRAPWGEDRPPSKEAFGSWFTEALTKWMDGDGSVDAESYADFTARVEVALRRTAERLAQLDPKGTAIVSTSGGPIAWAVAHLIGAGSGSWQPLNRVTVNSSVTTVVSGASGLSLITFNEHPHLPTEQVTYR
ncbi:histidine phosphatase family protein [Nocardioidaceae bacterium]|nr:histidine phosphatase family protein [Nocardioidaceae bacterium]